MSRFAVTILALTAALACHAQVTLTRGTNFSVDVAHDGRIAMDLLGSIWVVPQAGGIAEPVTDGQLPAHRPRWAPDASAIAFQARTNDKDQLWLYRFDTDESSNVSVGGYLDQHPAWSPDGERLVYSSDRRDTGFDLWEIDLATGLTWRISNLTGDETEPAWSADSRDLAYIHYHDEQWSLVLRRRGQPDRILETSPTRLSAPAWRPDGSLLTVLRHGQEGLVIDMVILSDPLLIRPLIEGEDFFVAPVTWPDRHRMLYAANGSIRTRLFNSWTSNTIPFRATVEKQVETHQPAAFRELPTIDAPDGRLVIRSKRLFDGVSRGYREGLDVVIEGGTISAIEERRDRPDTIVIDMGDLTLLPGLVDADAGLPDSVGASLGPLLLSYGVTTVVAAHSAADALNERWSGKELPGPRVLGPSWQLDSETVAAMMPSTDSLPLSPRGNRYEDAQLTNGSTPVTLLSGLADARTAGLAQVLESRQAGLLGNYPAPVRRFSEKPRLNAASPSIVLGSRPNGLPPGIATHAELLALAEAGLGGDKVLQSAGVNAASALGLGFQLGRIAPGAKADLVLVDGDPLSDVADLLNVVGIVRNGRFYSAIGLIERSTGTDIVE